MQLLAATAVASAIREGWEESEAFVTDLVATKPEWDAEELKALVVGQLHQAKPLAKANFGVFNSVSFFRTGGIPRGFPPVLPLQVKKFHFLDSQSPAAIAAAEDAEKPFSHLKPIHDVAEIGFTVAMTEQARKIEKSMRDVDDELLRLTTSPKDEKDRQKNVAVKLRNLANCIRNILAGADSMLHPTARVRVGKGILKSTSASQYPHRGQSEVSITAILSEQGNEVQNPIYSQRLTLPAGINARTETLRRFLGLSRETGPLSEGESHNRVFMANVMKHIDFKTFDSVPPLSPFRIALVIAALGEAGTAHDFLTEIGMRSAPSVVIRNRATIRALCSLPGMAKAATGLSIPFDPFDRLPVFLTPAAIALSSLVTNAGTRQGDGMTTVWGAHVAPIHSISLPFTVVDGGFKAAAKPEPYDMTKVLSGTIKGVKKFNPNDWIFASTALMWDLNARLGIFGGSYDAAAAAINAVAAGAELGVLNVVWHAFIVLKQTGASSDGRIPSVPFGDSSFSATTLLSRGLSACVTQLKQPLWRLLAELLSALDSGSWDKSARLAAVEKAPHTFDAAKVLAEGTVLESVTTPQFKGGPTDLPVTLTVSRHGNQHYAVVCVPTVCKSPLVMNCRDAYLAAAVHQCITTECVPFVAAAVAGAEELKPCAVEAAAALQRMATYASTTPVTAAS